VAKYKKFEKINIKSKMLRAEISGQDGYKQAFLASLSPGKAKTTKVTAKPAVPIQSLNQDTKTFSNRSKQKQTIVLPFKDKRKTGGYMVDKFKPAPGVTCLINQHTTVDVTSRQKTSRGSKKTPFNTGTVSPFSTDDYKVSLTPISI